MIKKIVSGERISRDEAVLLFSWNIHDLAFAADSRRKIIHPDETVGFVIDRIINYTNECEAMCKFCAYHARAGKIDPYTLTIDEILKKIGELVKLGGNQVMLQGGLSPDFTMERVEDILRTVKGKYPGVYLHSFSPSEIVYLSKKNGLSYVEIIRRLKSAGLNSIPGASDMLVDRIRYAVSPNKSTKDEWCNVMRALRENDMGSTATMTYGMGETLSERVEHLDVVRSIQDETGIIRAFIPWSFSPKNTGMAEIAPATGIDYLKIVAISRIYLDNVRYIHAGWLTEGLKLAQLALSYGANDMGGVLMEELVVNATGVETRANVDELVSIIRNAGKIPLLRDSEYNILKKYD